MRSIFCYSISAKNKDIFFLKANISCIFLQTCMLEHKASNFSFAVGLRTMMNFMAYNFTKCKVKRYCNHPNEKENYNFNNIKTNKIGLFCCLIERWWMEMYYWYCESISTVEILNHMQCCCSFQKFIFQIFF